MMDWTQILIDAKIEEPPGYKETVELCHKRKLAGKVTKNAAQKRKGAKQ